MAAQLKLSLPMTSMLALGIEGTAHTFGAGVMDCTKILANARDMYVPKKGSGIHPAEAAAHHRAVSKTIFDEAVAQAGVSLDDIGFVAYSAGPGLAPCLLAAKEFAASLKKPLIEVNHPVAHIEIGRMLCGSKDPVVLYVSGGNTQILGYAAGKYRVFGETQDIAIGNAIDSLIRETTGEFPGGPVFDRYAAKGKEYIELPYVVKGMDLSFTGILTAALKKYQEGHALDDICYSFQETCYAMLVEVTERALAHTGKKEVLVAGGVAASKRFAEMIALMCEDRGANSAPVPAEYARDNGTMICWAGMLAREHGQPFAATPDIYPRWRTDEVDVTWR